MRTGGLVILAMCLFAAAVRADEELKWGEGRARQSESRGPSGP